MFHTPLITYSSEPKKKALSHQNMKHASNQGTMRRIPPKKFIGICQQSRQQFECKCKNKTKQTGQFARTEIFWSPKKALIPCK